MGLYGMLWKARERVARRPSTGLEDGLATLFYTSLSSMTDWAIQLFLCALASTSNECMLHWLWLRPWLRLTYRPYLPPAIHTLRSHRANGKSALALFYWVMFHRTKQTSSTMKSARRGKIYMFEDVHML
jgi:hypothetical protein